MQSLEVCAWCDDFFDEEDGDAVPTERGLMHEACAACAYPDDNGDSDTRWLR